MAGDKVMMAVEQGDAVRQAELLVLGQMRDQIGAMTQELVENRKTLVVVREDVASIKATQASNADMKQKMTALEDQVDELRMRNAKQDGAAALFQFLKDYGGWLAGLGGLAYGLFLHH